MPLYHFDLVNTKTNFDAGDAELPDDVEAIDIADLIARRVLREQAGGLGIATDADPRHGRRKASRSAASRIDIAPTERSARNDCMPMPSCWPPKSAHARFKWL